MSGTLYEQRFIVTCISHGLHPHPSIGDYLPHDLIVQNSAGRCFRVQVKGTDTLVRSSDVSSGPKEGRYRITAKQGASNDIDCTLVDVVVAYVAPTNSWYVIPCTELTSQVVWLYPANETSKGQYEKYLERWETFS